MTMYVNIHKHKFAALLFTSLFFFQLAFAGTHKKSERSAELMKKYKASAGFIENKGQFKMADGKPADNILFKANSPEADVYITTTGISYVFLQKTENEHEHYSKMKKTEAKGLTKRIMEEQMKSKIEVSRMDMLLKNANIKQQNIVMENVQSWSYNYILPQFPDGLYDVKAYRKITIKEIYPGIDWILYTTESEINSPARVKYDFILHKGADPKNICLVYDGAKNINKQSDGSLLIKGSLGDVKEGTPKSFQNAVAVTSAYAVSGKEVRFSLGEYDASKTLVIDPSLIWSTYYAGGGLDGPQSIITDVFGNVFITGYMSSTDVPLYNPGGGVYTQTNVGGSFILKFDNKGVMLWATYIGGNSGADGTAVACDKTGSLYLAGAAGDSLPLKNMGGAYNQTFGGGYDAFILKFDPTGVYKWGTYFGGSLMETLYELTLDTLGNIYATGGTQSATDFPLKNLAGAYNQAYAGDGSGNFGDAYVAKFDAAGALQWATCFGGTNGDEGTGIHVDKKGNIYVGGGTTSSDLPTLDPGSGAFFQNFYAGTGFWGDSFYGDAFLLKFNSAGVRQWATYYGGNDLDLVSYGHSVSTDSKGNVFFVGGTNSIDLTTLDAGNCAYYQDTSGSGSNGSSFWGEDWFILKFDTICKMQWGTYYGGTSSEDTGPFGRPTISIDLNDNIFIAGSTSSTDIPLYDPGAGYFYNSNITGCFFMQFNSLLRLVWGTHYGYAGAGSTLFPRSSAHNNSGVYYLTGEGNGLNPVDPGNGAYYQATGAGTSSADDGFVSELTTVTYINGNILVTPPGGNLCGSTSLTLTAVGSTNYSWNPASGVSNPTGAVVVVSPNVTTTYTVTGMFGACPVSTPVTITVGPLNADFNYSPSTTLVAPQTICFTNASANANTYTWDMGNGNNSSSLNPGCFTYSVAGTYCVKLFSSDNGTCLDSAIKCFTLDDKAKLDSIPNVFSPDGDGINESFTMRNISSVNPALIKTFRCDIYDRWGAVIYGWDGITGKWSGTNTKGDKVPDGTYYYVLIVSPLNGDTVEKKGFVQLMRGSK